MNGPRQAPAVLVLTGGLIHLVHQLAVVRELPELTAAPSDGEPALPPPIGVLITGVLRRDPVALTGLHGAIERWLDLLRLRDPEAFGGLHLLPDESAAAAERWSIVCLNNQWLQGQRSVIERLDLRDWVVCGDGLGIYYRCARELRALLPSLLNRPIPEPGRRVRYVLSGRQPLWHRPPVPAQLPPERRRLELFETLVASQEVGAAPAVQACLAAAEGAPPGRPLWLCSVPNLAHQFPDGRIPMAVLEPWRRQLERRHGFDPACDRLVLIDHPKAPPQGSFGPRHEPWLAGPLRMPVALEVLVELLIRSRSGRPVVVAGLTSALYGVRRLTGAEVVWLDLAPLWRGNPLYRRRPLEFLHRWLRVARMAWITRSG
ncbi:hypothetical protein NZK32_05660 [Cyanobium sp. FGCU-52]|nr:hypothetical protein [Cyanobium sp. FGCU52]